MPSQDRLRKKAKQVVTRLKRGHGRLVLAESCTGGLLASLFTEIPGVSEIFCGSYVTYREGSKRSWLGVPAADLKRFSAVSAKVAEAMVRGALRKTPEATIAGAVTGYLGPTGDQVGLVYLSVFQRGMRNPVTLKMNIGTVRGSAEGARLVRRAIAANKLLDLLRALLNSNGKTEKHAKF